MVAEVMDPEQCGGLAVFQFVVFRAPRGLSWFCCAGRGFSVDSGCPPLVGRGGGFSPRLLYIVFIGRALGAELGVRAAL